MGQRLRVDYREGRGRGLLHLGGVERGPAGDAGLAVQTGLAVRFDVVAVPAIAESIVDLDEVDDAVLAALFGPDGPALRGTGLDELTIADDREPLLWLASRQAVLLLYRELPIVPGPIDRWSVEACLSWAALEDEGLPVQELTAREIGVWRPSWPISRAHRSPETRFLAGPRSWPLIASLRRPPPLVSWPTSLTPCVPARPTPWMPRWPRSSRSRPSTIDSPTRILAEVRAVSAMSRNRRRPASSK